MKLFVTGARGFIGRNCIDLLENTNFEIHALSSSKVSPEIKNNIIWHQGDLLNFNNISNILTEVNPTHLLHLAWITTPTIYWNSKENYNWVISSLKLIEKFTSLGGERIVVAGTCVEYDLNYGFLSEKLTPLNPDSVYGSCKYALYTLLNSFSKSNECISWAWGRIFYPYGKYENSNKLVPYVINSLLNNRQALCSHGQQIRDYIYASDVADIFIKLLTNDIQGPINIGSGSPLQLKDLIYRIGKKLNKTDLIKFEAIESNHNESPIILADTNRLKNEMKWKPKYTLNENLKSTINWWKTRYEGVQ
jgi:nucleoside-diphosphate-sugar epimerase